jgi:hypothetical protein
MEVNNVIEGLKIWWKNFTMSAEERWLSQSADVVELENKLRQLWNYNHYDNHHNHIGGL